MRKAKIVRCLVVAGGMLLLAAAPSSAMSITDRNVADLNVIIATAEDDALNELLIQEDYNENDLVGYPSHDGMAVVDTDQAGIVWFDKVVSFTAGDLDGRWALDFRVHNTTPWCWSDYHFEFWNDDFTQKLVDFPLEDWSNDIFRNSAYPGPRGGGGVLEFWAASPPAWLGGDADRDGDVDIDDASAVVGNFQTTGMGWAQGDFDGDSDVDIDDAGILLLNFGRSYQSPDWQCPSQTNQFVLIFDPSLVNAGQPGSFGIRQVATTVPEPLTLAGVFGGVAGLGAYLRKRRKA